MNDFFFTHFYGQVYVIKTNYVCVLYKYIIHDMVHMHINQIIFMVKFCYVELERE